MGARPFPAPFIAPPACDTYTCPSLGTRPRPQGFLTAARMADQLENLKAWVRGRTNRSDDIERWLVKQVGGWVGARTARSVSLVGADGARLPFAHG